MPKKNQIGNLALAGYNDLFSSTVSNGAADNTPSATTTNSHNPDSEQLVQLPLEELYPPEFHPFQVNDDEEMDRLAENIKTFGVREPGLVRPRRNENGEPIGGYELLVGNRRKRGCEIAGLPCNRLCSHCVWFSFYTAEKKFEKFLVFA